MAKKVLQGVGQVQVDLEMARPTLSAELWPFDASQLISAAQSRRDHWQNIMAGQKAVFLEHFADELPAGVTVDTSLINIEEIEVDRGGHVTYSTSSSFSAPKGFTLSEASSKAKEEYERAKREARRFHRYFELFKMEANKGRTFNLAIHEVEDFGIYRMPS